MKKILVIDNDPKILELVKARLEANQYQVVSATDGEEGLSKAESERPDLVIADIKMPKVDGYTFVRQFKKDESNKKVPIIILTGYANMKDLFAVEGIDDYLVKPFEAETLLKKIAPYFDSNKSKFQAKGRVLILNDDPEISGLLATRLQNSGFEIMAASDSEKGLQKVRLEHPDLILLDFHLKPLSGEEVCKAIRGDKDEKVAGIPIIMLSAKKFQADPIVGRVIGANSYLTKPLNSDVLMEQVQRILAKHE